MKYFYTYLIYCFEPKSSMYGCIYYGQHRTNNLLDGYITSGKKIQRYINKYPNGFYRKILHLYNSEDEVNKAEYDLIHPHLDKEYCLNLRDGGNIGRMSINSRHKMSIKAKERTGEKNAFFGKVHTEKSKRLQSEGRKQSYYSKTEEQRKAEYDSRRGKQESQELRLQKSIKMKNLFDKEPERRKIISERNKGKQSPIKGKHKVWDNKDKNIFHYE